MVTTFFGADSKVGCTMVTQVVAEELANTLPEAKVLVLHLDGTPGTYYVKERIGSGIDSLKAAITTGVLNLDELISICGVDENLYTLKGTTSKTERHIVYTTDMIDKLLKVVGKGFDYILIDAGSNIDSPLTVGSLISGLIDKKVLVNTQQKVTFENFIVTDNQVLTPLNIDFDCMIINKFAFSAGKFLETEKTLSEKYAVSEEYTFTIPMSEYGWQAEYESVSLRSYRDKSYLKSVEHIVNKIYNPIPTEEKKSFLGLFGK